MSDLISKSETIDLLYQVFEKHSMATDKNDFLGGFGAELFKNIKAMPTAYSVDKGDMIQKMLKEEYNKAINDLIAECENAKFAESDEISLSDVHTGVNSGLSMAIHFAEHLKVGGNS